MPKDWRDYIGSFTCPSDFKTALLGGYEQRSRPFIDSTIPTIRSPPKTFVHFVERRNNLSRNMKSMICKWKVNTLEMLDTNIKIKTRQRKSDKKHDIIASIQRGMSPKKKHEVQNFGHFIKEKFDSVLSGTENFIIDIGSGLGYLDQFLWYLYDYRIIGIESCSNHGQAADKRNTFLTRSEDHNSINRKPRQIICSLENTEESIRNLSKEIDAHRVSKPKGDYQFPQLMVASQHNYQHKYTSAVDTGVAVLVGLHACGDLSSATLNLFSSNPSIYEICLISCCYHKMKQFPISKFYQNCCVEIKVPAEPKDQSPPRDYSCITSSYALRLASQEPFSRYVLQACDFCVSWI